MPMISTRLVLLSAAFGSCAWAQAQSQTQSPLAACLPALRAQSPANGVSAAEFDRQARGSQWQTITIERSKKQPEFTVDWPTYLARAVSDQRIATGRDLRTSAASALQQVSATYGVDAAVVLAVWGIESNFGQSMGDVPVLDAWMTRACAEPTKKLWRQNVYASMRLLRDGVVTREQFNGSWSGAFGLTQFIPTSFEQYARDGDGDRRIDLYASVPDALASTANHLASRTKWLHGVPAAIEVRFPPRLLAAVPAGDDEYRGRDERPIGDWLADGVEPVDESMRILPAQLLAVKAALFLVQGRLGRAFLVTQNFDALLAYNRSTKYALAVALIAAAIDSR